MTQKVSLTRVKSLHLWLAAAALLMALLAMPGYRAHEASGRAANEAAALQIPRPWTAVGSTGAVDESSLSAFSVTGSNLGFAAASSATSLVARYNVTNTFDNNANPNKPGWAQMEMTSIAPAGSTVTAKLNKVDKCTGVVTGICAATNAGGGGPLCSFCQFAAGTIDFTSELYYVEVTLSRQAGALPRVYALRVY